MGSHLGVAWPLKPSLEWGCVGEESAGNGFATEFSMCFVTVAAVYKQTLGGFLDSRCSHTISSSCPRWMNGDQAAADRNEDRQVSAETLGLLGAGPTAVKTA